MFAICHCDMSPTPVRYRLLWLTWGKRRGRNRLRDSTSGTVTKLVFLFYQSSTYFKKYDSWYFLVFNILTGDLWQVTKWRPWTLTTQHSQLCGRPLSPSTRITVKNVLRFGELTSWKTKKILTSVFCEACTRLVEPGSSMQKHRQPTDKNNTVTKIM